MVKKEHVLFLSLKTMESDILRIDNLCVGLLKYLKGIKNYNDKLKQILLIDNIEEKYLSLMELKDNLKEFKYAPLVVREKPDSKESINSITLRSEYSDDLNEFMKENQQKNKIKTNKIKLIDVNFERSRTFTPKVDRKKEKTSYERSIIDGSVVMDTKSFKVEESAIAKSLSVKVAE